MEWESMEKEKMGTCTLCGKKYKDRGESCNTKSCF